MTVAHRPENRAALCDGKDRLAADVAKRIASRMRKTRQDRINAYRCPACGSWHVGTAPPKPERPIR